MAEVIISEGEKSFILHGIQQAIRCDGRSNLDYRPIQLETGVVTHASGSARLRLANTDVLVGVKAEVDTPQPDLPREGRIHFFVDCSANATPVFEGRGGEALGTDIAESLSGAYSGTNVLNLKDLCILPGKFCWVLYVDILILECGGNCTTRYRSLSARHCITHGCQSCAPPNRMVGNLNWSSRIKWTTIKL